MPEPSLPSLDDFADAEHCVLEDVTAEHPALENALEGGRETAREIRKERAIVDKLRRRRTTFRFYAESWVDVETEKRGHDPSCHRVDLHYLDPVPAIDRYRPVRLIKATGILAAVTGVAFVPAIVGWFPLYSVSVAVIGGIATLATLFAYIYMSHEKIVFRTLHGRADALRLTAGLGTIKRFHALLPEIVNAIADAAESVHEQTAVYLRSEMREHYRLRNAGILSTEECADSTDRILSEFEGFP